MDKKESLTILIDHSSLFDDETKKKLKDFIPSMTEEEISALGTILASDKREIITDNQAHMDHIDSFIERIDKLIP